MLQKTVITKLKLIKIFYNTFCGNVNKEIATTDIDKEEKQITSVNKSIWTFTKTLSKEKCIVAKEQKEEMSVDLKTPFGEDLRGFIFRNNINYNQIAVIYHMLIFIRKTEVMNCSLIQKSNWFII